MGLQMHKLETAQFGSLIYRDSDVYRFPLGLPGFEDRYDFVLVERPEFSPILFLQSTEQGSLRFACAPVQIIDPGYKPSLSEIEAGLLEPGSLRVVLGILTFPESHPPTINLLAPVVLNPETRVGVQSIQLESGYRAAHPLHVEDSEPVEAACS